MDKKAAHSRLFREFEPKSLLPACQAHFNRVEGNRYDLRFRFSRSISRPIPTRYSALRDNFRNKLKATSRGPQGRPAKMAKGSGVEKVGEPPTR